MDNDMRMKAWQIMEALTAWARVKFGATTKLSCLPAQRHLRAALWSIVASGLMAQETARNVFTTPADLTVPSVLSVEPAAGKRVRATTAGWEQTSVYHALYLPGDWEKGKTLPVIVEYAGNGGYLRNGDTSFGTVEGCSLGYGLTKGRGVIWVCLPLVDTQNGHKQNSTIWWGDVEETKRYCIATVRDVCQRFGADAKHVMLAGFSRGAIACNFIGLHDDEIASLWCGFFCHSHYDGVKENWPYADADRKSALARLRRLGGRPQWISHERGVDETQNYLRGTGIAGDFTFVPLPYGNHTDQWVLRDIPERKQAREWLQRVFAR
jgi:hypothetical protein